MHKFQLSEKCCTIRRNLICKITSELHEAAYTRCRRTLKHRLDVKVEFMITVAWHRFEVTNMKLMKKLLQNRPCCVDLTIFDILFLEIESEKFRPDANV